MPRKLLLGALLLPLVVISIGMIRAETHLANNRRWVFEVNGYDPRDLLRGRYLQFQLLLDEQPPISNCNDDHSDRCCLCLTATGAAQPPQVARATCAEAKAQCDGVLQTRYLKQLRRYYIPEEDAWKIEQRFQEAAADNAARLWVSIDKDGKPQIHSLLVYGETIRAPAE